MKRYELAINMAMTLDGKVARPDGKWYGLCSLEDKQMMDIYRSRAEILIVGKNSIINDDPRVNLKYLTNSKSPRPVILIRKGSISADKKVFKDSTKKPLVFCLKSNYSEVNSELNSLAEIILLDSDNIEPETVLLKLQDMGYSKFLLEGGPKLNYSFFKADLINRIHLTIVPYLIGMNSLPSILDGINPISNFEKNQWVLESVKQVDNEIFLIYNKQNNYSNNFSTV